MVSLRCKTSVKTELSNLGLQCINIEPGVVEIEEDIAVDQRKLLKATLKKAGMELMDLASSAHIEQVICEIEKMILYSEEVPDVVYADYLSKQLNVDFAVLSTMFSEVKGLTVNQFIKVTKIERAKEMLLYDVLSIKEIALKLNYKSVPGLSSEFQKVTGLTLTFFQDLKKKRKFRPDKK